MAQFYIREIDSSGLNEFIGAFQRALKITSRDAVEYQTGLLMKDLVTNSPPKTLEKAGRKATWQVRKSFYAVKRGDDQWKFGGDKPLFTEEQAKGKNVRWLYGAPQFLVGTPKAFDKTGITASQMMVLHKREQKRSEKRWVDNGMRGKQRVMLVHKPVVKAASARAFRKTVQDSFGKLKASFAKGFNTVRAKFNMPSFVKKHLFDSKGGFVPVRPNDLSPSTTIISRSPGCEHENEIRIINGAVKKRSASIKKDIQLFLSKRKSAEDFRRERGFPKFEASLTE